MSSLKQKLQGNQEKIKQLYNHFLVSNFSANTFAASFIQQDHKITLQVYYLMDTNERMILKQNLKSGINGNSQKVGLFIMALKSIEIIESDSIKNTIQSKENEKLDLILNSVNDIKKKMHENQMTEQQKQFQSFKKKIRHYLKLAFYVLSFVTTLVCGIAWSLWTFVPILVAGILLGILLIMGVLFLIQEKWIKCFFEKFGKKQELKGNDPKKPSSLQEKNNGIELQKNLA